MKIKENDYKILRNAILKVKVKYPNEKKPWNLQIAIWMH